jgi:hypothetical protein
LNTKNPKSKVNGLLSNKYVNQQLIDEINENRLPCRSTLIKHHIIIQKVSQLVHLEYESQILNLDMNTCKAGANQSIMGQIP